MKFCRDCLHFESADELCYHPTNTKTDPVSGKVVSSSVWAATMRQANRPCGKEGKLFQKKKG